MLCGVLMLFKRCFGGYRVFSNYELDEGTPNLNRHQGLCHDDHVQFWLGQWPQVVSLLGGFGGAGGVETSV